MSPILVSCWKSAAESNRWGFGFVNWSDPARDGLSTPIGGINVGNLSADWVTARFVPSDYGMSAGAYSVLRVFMDQNYLQGPLPFLFPGTNTPVTLSISDPDLVLEFPLPVPALTCRFIILQGP